MKKRLFNILLGLALVMGLMMGVSTMTYAADPQSQNTNYLTFTGEEQFTLSTEDNTKIWDDGKMEYSTDTTSWTEWDGSKVLSSSTSAPHVLYLRGKNNTKVGGSSEKRFYLNKPVACSGNIMTLLDYENPGTELKEKYTFANLFYNCRNLTSAPELPATRLAEHCYSYMFSGCTSLETAPALGATTLAENCYFGMFNKCTILKKVPALEATSLAEECYSYMFSECTSLETAPALPATTLAKYCYANMFYGCTGLSSAPELPATRLADYRNWYKWLFERDV